MERERDHKTPPPIPPRGNNKSANIVGFAIVFLGMALLMRNLDLGFPFPRNIFGWEMILIIIGIVIGINSKFEKKSSIILIAIGGLFFLKRFLDVPFWGTIFPMMAIILGIYFIVRNRNQSTPPIPPYTPSDKDKDEFDWDKRVDVANEPADAYKSSFERPRDGSLDDQQQTKKAYTYEGENYIKVESIFGYAKKIIFSKNFRGGTMTNLFGSTEINLLQADIQQPVALDVFQLFGSTKIIVPPHWIVATTASSILSENDDRRVILANVTDQNKCLYITGTSIFGNITIKNS
ncbi:LiaF transmembrane domain-containing protein [Sphingobacterium gobiense]|uniref:LiaF transmembrane domain-containing protein n=1 Tax=Sphingobacterium gobiense TaxID=1382456 RepID=A0A2S9JVG3_9SPHI|nr:hypothetical protein [Sphingobacterium gobiense]PRD57255.1 hypothetical protein C5749_08670 [Sphingobacterium gobiense]